MAYPDSDALVRGYDIEYYYGDHRVLTDVNVEVHTGQRLALIGENGSGKTTLLRLLAGDLEMDRGKVFRPADSQLLRQEIDLDYGYTVQGIIDEALAAARLLEQELADAGSGLALDPALSGEALEEAALAAQDRFDAALAAAEIGDVWNAELRVEQTLYGLGLADIERDRSLREISGGQLGRRALAALLIQRPTAMFMDEPTNHLDDQAMEYLQDTLRQFPGVIVFASHDRVFLDQVATSIYDLDPFATPALKVNVQQRKRSEIDVEGDPRLYRGGYSAYRVQKRRERRAWQAQYDTEQAEIAWLQNDGDERARSVSHQAASKDNDKMAHNRRGGRVDATIASQVRSVERRLLVLERDQIIKPPVVLTLDGSSLNTSQAAHELISAERNADGSPLLVISVDNAAFEGRVAPTSLEVFPGTKLLLTGSNGSGKSTLLLMMAGNLKPTSGTVTHRRKLSIALLEQEIGMANDERTPQEIYDIVTEPLVKAPTLKDLGLIAPQDFNKPMMYLSTGQRRRLILAVLIARTPDVLLLDEPTNHLSLTLVEELSAAIGSTKTTVVVASHDRWLRSTWPRKARKLKLTAL